MHTVPHWRELPEVLDIRAGDYLKPDGWGMGNMLRASEWDRADFYLPTNSGGPIKALAVNLTVTGRQLRRASHSDSPCIRVRIEFVGDGEPSALTHGWLWLAETEGRRW